MIKYLEGTVFNSPAKTIVNTVNCAGVMGAGIALEFKLRYPEMYEEYLIQCDNKQISVGIPRIYEISNSRWIMNFPTKAHWRYPSKIKWIEDGLLYFVQNYKKRNIESIAFPKLGTNNGGLDWKDVKPIMEKYLSNIDIPVYICLDELKNPDGTEKEMINKLESINILNDYKDIGISKKSAQTIIDSLPIHRFWHLYNISGISKSAYEKLFIYLYKQTTEYKNSIDKIVYVETEQLKFI